MDNLWQTTLTGAALATVLSGGANAGYFGNVALRSTEPGRRLGAQVLAVVNTAVALQSGLRAVAAFRSEAAGLGAEVLVQGLMAGGALATSAVIARRLWAGKGGRG